MTDHPVAATHDAWLAARRQLLIEEKELTRLRDRIAAARRALTWRKVEKDYRFEGPEGSDLPFAALFGGKRQLLVYHFVFAPESDGPSPTCAFWADGFNGVGPHLEARNTRLVAVSRAPREKLAAAARRLGWTFPWYSAGDGPFNYDMHVSFRPDEVFEGGVVRYNYAPLVTNQTDLPGVSAYIQEPDGAIYRTYTAYARGLDLINPAYQLLDLTPLGRQEDGLARPMAWLRLHDEYGS